MDIATKVFLINWVVIFCVVLVDNLTSANLQENKKILLWFGLTVVSVPVYAIYVILGWS